MGSTVASMIDELLASVLTTSEERLFSLSLFGILLFIFYGVLIIGATKVLTPFARASNLVFLPIHNSRCTPM